MFANKTIGEAKYLQKSSGDYIPFRMEFIDSDCDLINEILKESAQWI